jgi:hypothetical protein
MSTGWSVVYGTEQLPLTSTEELLNAPSTFQHVDGDGVVPVASSSAGAQVPPCFRVTSNEMAACICALQMLV